MEEGGEGRRGRRTYNRRRRMEEPPRGCGSDQRRCPELLLSRIRTLGNSINLGDNLDSFSAPTRRAMDLLQMMLSVRPVHAAVSMPHPAALHRIPARPVHVACVAPTQLPLRPRFRPRAFAPSTRPTNSRSRPPSAPVSEPALRSRSLLSFAKRHTQTP